MQLVIRRNRQKDLSLEMNKEKVYFLFHHDVIIYNNLDYNKVSDYFNLLGREWGD